MKKKLLKIFSVMLAAMTCFSLVACGDTGTSEDGGTVDPTTGKRILKFEYLKAGIGNTPYEKIAEAFMEEHPDVLVKLVPNVNIISTTSAKLESNNNLADVYSYRSIEAIKRWGVKGWIEPIDDVFSAELSTGKTVEEAMTEPAVKNGKYMDHYYAIPEYTQVPGFVYNKTLFDKYGWEVPETSYELEQLCKQILADTDGKVSPIVYCGAAADGYLYTPVNGVAYQYEGIANLDSFFSYSSAEVYSPENSQGKAYGLEFLKKFFFDNVGTYTMEGSVGLDHITAQTLVIRGDAAMIPCGSWFETEMSKVLEKNPEMEMAMMPIPQISDDKNNVLHAEGYTTVDDKRVLESAFGSNYFIPANAANKEDAKEFLKFLSEPKANLIYTQYSNNIRPFDYELDSGAEEYKDMSAFGKSILDIANTHYLYQDNTTAEIAVAGLTGWWSTGYPFYKIRDGLKTIKQIIQDEYNHATDNWDSWVKLAGSSK